MTETEDHMEAIDAYDAHVKHSSGCIMRCTTTYDPGKAHSHRWQAARRARNETRVPYNNYPITARKLMWGSKDRMQRLSASNIQHDTGKRWSGMAPAFSTQDYPFNNNAHHIIPVGPFMKCILDAAQNAAPNVTRMENIVVGGILKEPYNINRKENMIVLPTEKSPAAIVLGLPIHTEGSCSHNNYSELVETEVRAVFSAKYDSLADEVSEEKHGAYGKHAPHPIRSAMDSISEAMYEVIIKVAVERQFLEQSLDSIRNELADKFSKIYSG